MQWVSKTKDLLVTLPDILSPGIWSPVQIQKDQWEACWEPLLNTLFVRRNAQSPELPLKYRSAVIKRFPGDMFAELALEYLGGPAQVTQSLYREWAMHVEGLEARSQATSSQGETVRSPMVGKVLRVHIELGQHVERGQELLVIEAMKMENKIFAKSPGKVQELLASAGQQVGVGQVLARLRPE